MFAALLPGNSKITGQNAQLRPPVSLVYHYVDYKKTTEYHVY